MKRSTFFNKISICVLTFILTLCGAFVSMFYSHNKDITANAATVSMDDKISISTWGEAEAGITWMHVQFNGFTVAGGDWHTADASKIAANNNSDPLDYTYINGKPAREHYADDSTSLTVMTATGWTEAYVVKVSKTYLDLGKFTFQLKAGFTLVGADGNVYTLQNDTGIYAWNEAGTFGSFGQSVAQTVDMDDKISISTWGEAETGITWMHVQFNGFTVAGGDWHTAPSSKFAGNNGVDPLDYTYINGKPAREHYNENNTSLTVMTATGWTEAYVVKVSKTYLDLGEFTFKLKAGFTLVGADGKAYVLKNDTATYGWTDGNFGVIVEEVEPAVKPLENQISNVSTWGIQEEKVWMHFEVSGFAPIAVEWNNATADQVAANNGVNPIDYIYINNVSVREHLAADANAMSVHTYGSWTNALVVKVNPAYLALGTFTIQYKAGLVVTGQDGVYYTLENDTSVYGWTGDAFGVIAQYTLTFEGTSVSKVLLKGEAIGELPAVPEKDGYTAIGWAIDGQTITAGSIYNYDGNKTATAVYEIVKSVVALDNKITIGTWGITEDKVWMHGETTFAPVAVEWNNATADQVEANNGVNPIDYIYIDGVSVREHLAADANAMSVHTYGSWTNALVVKVNPAYLALGTFTIQYKAGLVVGGQDNVYYTLENDTALYGWVDGNFGVLAQYTLTFAGTDVSKVLIMGDEIGELPEVPEKAGYDGVWTIDGVEISGTTIYNYGADKTAVAVYSADITKYIGVEDRTSWGAHDGEFYFGVLDKREENKVVNGESTTYYLNSSVTGCWYVGNDAIIAANNGVDIMQYIYINGTSARDLITQNASGQQLVNNCGCWLSNPAASPIYVETTSGSGIMIRVLQKFTGNYFEITFKSGLSLKNENGAVVYLSEDVTYKYIVSDEGATLAKGELTDADLDQLNGQTITLMNGNETYLTKKTCRLTLPEIAPVIVDNGLSQVFVGWTTDVNTLAVLYPAGYRLEPAAATTLYAVWIGFEMQDGAAVRLVANSSGLRFLTDIDANAYNAGFNGRLISVGTFLVPTDYLETGVDFVHSSFAEGYYLDKETATWRVQTGNTWTYAAAFVNISESQFARSFSARGYLKIEFTSGVGYVYTPYSAENNARSIYEVALEAYNDARYPEYKTNETILHYINSVANLTWDEADYTFAKTTGVAGNYEITDISLDGNTVTVSLEGDVSSAVINGKRLTSGSSSNVKMGDFLFNVSGFEKVAEGFRFTFGAAATTYAKESDETLYFNSSDEDLDFFLNDYFKRHSGYTEDGVDLKVNSVTAGVNAEEFFNHEWMSMSYYWYNSFDGYTDANGYNQDRIEGLRRVLSSVPVDDYGYVWSSNDRVRDAKSEIDSGEQKMGWPFPNNKTVGTMHWEFNGKDSKSWSDNIGGSIKNGLRTANISNRTDDIIFQSNTWKSITGSKIYTYYAPLLEFELRIDNADSIQDIYVGYTTSEQSTLQWVSVKDYAFIAYPYSGAYNHIVYMPMYAFSGWGASTSTYITQIQIKIDVKDGQSMSGNVGLNYVRPTFDTRMSNNNSILISSLRTDYDYTGDLTYLADNITRARKAMNFLMQMYDSARGLKRESYIVGHDAKKESLNWLGQAKNISIAGSISQGYWDIMFMPEYDFQSNMYFYKAVRDMAYLEGILEANNITVDKSLAAVKTADRAYNKSVSAYNSDNLESVANTVLTNLRQTTENTNHTGFWDATDGRFVAGYSSYEGKWYDYGYVTWNLEAIYYGIATESQAAAIMNWLSRESDLYDYVFAPRSNTVEGTDMLNGEYAAMKGDWDFGDNCQYGGAIMYSSFYDLMARLDTLGADNAFARLTAIQDWYKEVYDYYVANGTDPYDFYRYYYDNKGIQCQGLGTAGALGLDREFLESFLPVSAVAYGFFGIDSVDGKTLEIAPKMPGSLDYWQMENLAFNKVKYDLKISKNGIQITDVRDAKAGLQIKVVLDIAQGQNVYVNGVKATDYEMVGTNQVAVTVDFATVVVEVK